MFISYQVSHHCLRPPYQIWGGATMAEALEVTKAEHIQGCMSRSVTSGWFFPSAQPLWGGFCTTGSSFGLPIQEKCWHIAVSPWSTWHERGCEKWICSHWRRKGWVEDGRAILFVFKYLEKDYREHKTLLKLLQWNATDFRRSYLDIRKMYSLERSTIPEEVPTEFVGFPYIFTTQSDKSLSNWIYLQNRQQEASLETSRGCFQTQLSCDSVEVALGYCHTVLWEFPIFLFFIFTSSKLGIFLSPMKITSHSESSSTSQEIRNQVFHAPFRSQKKQLHLWPCSPISDYS